VRLLCASAAAALLLLAAESRLEAVADAERLTCTVLEVLPVCSPAIQQQLVGFLPEVVLPQDHEVRECSEAEVDRLAGSTMRTAMRQSQQL
jgi:hypothetical protein